MKCKLFLLLSFSLHQKSSSFLINKAPYSATKYPNKTLKNELDSNNENTLTKKEPRPITLPPRFVENLTISIDTPFEVTREGPPLKEELANDNLLKILAEVSNEEDANVLVWKCLGYRYDSQTDSWTADEVFPKWREKYPSPPDFIGVTKVHEREVDEPVKLAIQALSRSVPMEYKQSLKEHLLWYGFSGFKLDELTPNRTRRAQVTNFLLYYREVLFGVSLEELIERRKNKAN
mmetsp:Transcript_6845/g.9610  ORF Transcript_6845/g.9610 Transcript_6845/m.9610 type:complete len:234 (+) Transcript_6845:38-739(+)